MKLSIVILFAIFALNVRAQTRYIDRGGKASFFSSAPMEDIRAETDRALSILDIKTGEIAASMLMRSFNFRKALMQEHFNENYVESDKYPRATFKGTITNIDQLDVHKDGVYSLNITGQITIHGVTKALNVTGEAVVDKGVIKAKAVFPLAVKDFDIQIPRLVVMNIAEQVEVTASFNYQPMDDTSLKK